MCGEIGYGLVRYVKERNHIYIQWFGWDRLSLIRYDMLWFGKERFHNHIRGLVLSGWLRLGV